MLRSHAIICVDRNGNESRREIPAKDWKDCFQRALAAEGTWRNFVRFQAADDPFNRVDRPGAPPPPALGKLGEAIEAAQHVRAEKQNSPPLNGAKNFDTTPEVRIGRGELAHIFARMLPQMPETFSRIELEKRAFDSTGQRYDIGDCHNAVQFLKEKNLVQPVSRGRYRIPDDVRQGKRTLNAHVRTKSSQAEAQNVEAPKPKTAPVSVPVQQAAAAPVIASGSLTPATTQSASAAPHEPKDVYSAIAGFASALVLPDAEEAERELTQILEVVTRFEAYVRRHLQAAKLRKELLAMIS